MTFNHLPFKVADTKLKQLLNNLCFLNLHMIHSLKSNFSSFRYFYFGISILLLLLPGISVNSFAQQAAANAKDKPAAPQILPGKGAKQFDFFMPVNKKHATCISYTTVKLPGRILTRLVKGKSVMQF